MGRGVETVRDAKVIYFDCSEYDEDGMDWTDLIENVRCSVNKKYPSLYEVRDKWAQHPYRENRIILENKFVSISVSEYCGCGAFSVFVRRDLWYNLEPALAERWLLRAYPGIHKIISEFVSELNKLGTFSNGESVFERKGK